MKKQRKVVNDKSLSSKAMLVSVKISAWSGRKIDEKATDTANVAHGANALAGRYNKSLLPGATELQEVNQMASKARKYFHEQTLPWMADGSRIISSKNYLSFQTEMRKIQRDFSAAVKNFEAAYPKLQKEAAKSLGGLFNSDEYPDSIAEKFSIDVKLLPMPDVKDFRVDVSENEKKRFMESMKEVENAAVKDCWERLHTVVKNAAEKLAKPDAIFRDSLLENVTEITELLPKLNITDDAELDKANEEVKKLVSGFKAEELRTDAKERSNASKELADIERKMGAIMSGYKAKVK